MLVLEADKLAAIILGLVILIAILYGSKEYWRAKAQALETQRTEGDGWRSEALFLRYRANKAAAEFAEEN